jgi:hypothetical protein
MSELRIYSAVISPHYGDTTDDGTPAGKNERQYDMHEMMA